MKAMVITGFGGPEVFEERDVPRPKPGPGQVLVKVHATSINPVDYKIRQSGAWAGVEPPAIIGYDVSGVVEEAGESTPTCQVDLEPGDEVFYTPEIFWGKGSYAEYHVADAAIVARKPAALSHAQAAALPLAGGTAWTALIARGRLMPGETVLIHGCGGVGHLALQIARAAGARVLVSCSDYMVPVARQLGADTAFDYREHDFVDVVHEETDGKGVQLVFDTVGGDILSRSVPATADFGAMVGIVSTGNVDLSQAYRKNLTLHAVFLQRARHQLQVLRRLAEWNKIRPVIDSVLPLNQVAEAHRRLQAGGVKGKLVLQVADESAA